MRRSALSLFYLFIFFIKHSHCFVPYVNSIRGRRRSERGKSQSGSKDKQLFALRLVRAEVRRNEGVSDQIEEQVFGEKSVVKALGTLQNKEREKTANVNSCRYVSHAAEQGEPC